MKNLEVLKSIVAALVVVGLLAGFAACTYDYLEYSDMEWGRGAPIEATAYSCVRPSFFGLIESSVDTCVQKTLKACLEYSSDSHAECSLEAKKIVEREYASRQRERHRAEVIKNVGET